MCLAPCFKGCSDEEYGAEVGRVQAFFESGGQSLVREISALRDAASNRLDFESAAGEHARIEKLKPVLAQLPEIVHRLDRLAGMIVQRSAEPESVNFFRVERGRIAGPMRFAIQAAEHTKTQSMESRVLEAMAGLPAGEAKSALETMEHLALLKRWYYRGTRAGEIFFADDKGQLPLRRVVRGASRVYRGEKEPGVEQTTVTGTPAS